jgi:hypothetical protein
MWRNMRTYQTIANNPCSHINAEQLVVSRMNYTMRIILCPLVLVVNTDDAVSTETCIICKEHWSSTELLSMSILSTYYKCTLPVITHKLYVSGHVLIWICFLVLVWGTSAQSALALFRYTLYIRYKAGRGLTSVDSSRKDNKICTSAQI